VVKVAVEVGDIVLYSKYGGSDVKVDGKELKICQEGEILAIVG
jgi:chaperonin GroES